MTDRHELNTTLILYLAVVFALVLWCYADNLRWLWSRWMENPNYSYGPLIPIISLFVIFQKKDLITNTDIRPSNRGLYILIPAILLQIIASRAQVNFISSYSLILVLVGIVLFLFGKKILRTLSFPILFLLFMVPFWAVPFRGFSNLLKLWSSICSFHILRVFGYPILREGVILRLGTGSLEVGDPCSGIRSLISLMALGTVVAYYSNSKLWKKLLLVFLAVPLAFLGNTLRVVFFGIMLESEGLLISEGPLHTMTGLVVFAFAFLGLIAFKKWLRI